MRNEILVILVDIYRRLKQSIYTFISDVVRMERSKLDAIYCLEVEGYEQRGYRVTVMA